MDFVGFALKCLDVLAWPLFGLGYPLCASIRAIEANSNSDMQKLITYWIVFSLISLFELCFVKLIEWLPFWLYLKIVATGWLVLPSFNGAYHVYECLVRPLLSVNPQDLINQFSKPKEGLSLKTGDFIAMAERYAKENGYEALEKFIAIKPMTAKPNKGVEVIKAVANTEKKEVAAAMQVKCQEPNLEQAEQRTVADEEIKEMTAEASASRENKLPVLTASKEVQREWACAVCQMTMQSEANLNSHLQGGKHRAKFELLKAGKQTYKNKSSSSSTTNESDQTTQEPKKRALRRRNKSGTTKQEGNVLMEGTNNQCKQRNVMYIDAETAPTFGCSTCNVMCPNEIHMASNLTGWN